MRHTRSENFLTLGAGAVYSSTWLTGRGMARRRDPGSGWETFSTRLSQRSFTGHTRRSQPLDHKVDPWRRQPPRVRSRSQGGGALLQTRPLHLLSQTTRGRPRQITSPIRFSSHIPGTDRLHLSSIHTLTPFPIKDCGSCTSVRSLDLPRWSLLSVYSLLFCLPVYYSVSPITIPAACLDLLACPSTLICLPPAVTLCPSITCVLYCLLLFNKLQMDPQASVSSQI